MIVGTCWYLAVLSLLASFGASLITVLPGDEPVMARTIVGCLACSLLFVASTVFLRSRDWRWIHESRLARTLFLGFAVLATLGLFPLVVG